MQGFTRASAVAVMPAPPASPGTPGWCTGGDPLTGVLPTIPGYEFFNGLWAEIKAILTAAGITPDAANLAQILQALNTLFIAAAGDTMTGQLTLVGDPAADGHAARKAYVDALIATRVWKNGDAMTGHLYLPGDPSDPNHAARKAYVDGTNSLSATGYKRHPGGLITQWGVVAPATQNISASVAVTFPLTFPGSCFVVIPTVETFDGAGLLDMAAGTNSPSASGVTLYAGTTLAEGTEVRTFGWRWMALGV